MSMRFFVCSLNASKKASCLNKLLMNYNVDNSVELKLLIMGSLIEIE